MRFKSYSIVFLILVAGGCTSTTGASRSLRQAAPAYAPPPARAPGPVRMGNTYRPAGTTLYGVGEAPPHGEEVPRSPNQRVLPPTAEPGLWAADEPQAARRKSPDWSAPTVDELLVATPSPGAPEAPGCRQRLLRASQKAGQEQMRNFLPQSARDCINARLIFYCMLTQTDEIEALARNTPRIDGVDYVAEHKRKTEAAHDWQRRTCHDVTMLMPFELVFTRVTEAFSRQAKGEKR